MLVQKKDWRDIFIFLLYRINKERYRKQNLVRSRGRELIERERELSSFSGHSKLKMSDESSWSLIFNRVNLNVFLTNDNFKHV